jgi:hypothetical protein
MASLAYPLAVLLDPVQSALVLAIVLVYRGPQPVIVAGVTAAAASETIMVVAASGYTWGEVMLPRLAACLMQAAVLHWIVTAILRMREPRDAARRGLSWLGITPPAGPAFGGLQKRSRAQRLAPWHMRAYVRRRLARLRRR